MKVGDKVICINDCSWYNDITNEDCDGPYLNEVLVIDGFETDTHIIFNKYGTGDGYNIKEFRKLITDHNFKNEVTEILANRPLVEERSDVVKEKELV